jgi:cytochrome c biogenesis protein CcmG/thiol:disulfide interchange protein DsbE
MLQRHVTSHRIPTPTAAWGVGRRRLLYAAPTIGFAGLAAVLGWGLTRNPRELPSSLIGRPVPGFSLPPVQGRTLGLSSADLRGEVSLVNVFASWCTACRVEHPLFMAMARAGEVPIHGLNYRDAPADAARWLDTLGDPYTRTGADRDGRVGIEWGIYGVPETFVISIDSRVMHRHAGPITPEVLAKTIRPLIDRLRREAGGVR